MSLTKSYVTPQEIEQARQLDLLYYLQQHEPEELVRFSSHVYTLRSHDSLKISNGKWYQWSTGIGGVSALDYLIKVQGMDFVSAVSKILRYSPLAEPAGPTPAKRQRSVFTLPTPYENNGRVRTYLTGRGLSMDLLRMCIDAGLIYEDVRHNCVFVGFDKDTVPRYAMLRSSDPSSTFLREVEGSDKRYSFSAPHSGSETLFVFESAIDCLSFIELQRMENPLRRPDNYLSLSGVYRPGEGRRTELPAALQEFLSANDGIRHIALCLDNDDAGVKAAMAICAAMPEGYTTELLPPEVGKDYNEQLILRKHIKTPVKTRGAQSARHHTMEEKAR